jgi:hypothetical protein
LGLDVLFFRVFSRNLMKGLQAYLIIMLTIFINDVTVQTSQSAPSPSDTYAPETNYYAESGECGNCERSNQSARDAPKRELHINQCINVNSYKRP